MEKETIQIHKPHLALMTPHSSHRRAQAQELVVWIAQPYWEMCFDFLLQWTEWNISLGSHKSVRGEHWNHFILGHSYTCTNQENIPHTYRMKIVLDATRIRPVYIANTTQCWRHWQCKVSYQDKTDSSSANTYSQPDSQRTGMQQRNATSCSQHRLWHKVKDASHGIKMGSFKLCQITAF